MEMHQAEGTNDGGAGGGEAAGREGTMHRCIPTVRQQLLRDKD